MDQRISDMWKHFIKSLPLTLGIMLLTAVTVLAASGTTDAPAAPGSTNSYTLEDIYQRLANGTAATQSAFTEPSLAPGSGSMHDINALMAAAPAVDDTDGATAADVSSGATFWGLTSGEWGLQTGSNSTAAGSDVVGPDGALTFSIPDGTYSGNSATAQDSDLMPLNIMKGVNIFGVEGKAQSGWSIYDQINNSYRFNVIEMVSAVDGWAARSDIQTDMTLYHFDGTDWSQHTLNIGWGRVNGISMLSADDGWAGTESGLIFHYNGATDSWDYHSNLSGSPRIRDIEMVSATDGWLVTYAGVIYRYIDTTDTWVLHSDMADSPVTDLEMVNASEGWMVTSTTRNTFHYDNGLDTWSFYQTVAVNANAISMVGANDGWIVGNNGNIVHLGFN